MKNAVNLLVGCVSVGVDVRKFTALADVQVASRVHKAQSEVAALAASGLYLHVVS